MTDRLAGVRLAPYTTLRVGGPAAAFIVAASQDELVETVAAADRAGERVLILGGGSNIVLADGGFDGVVVRVASVGVDTEGLTDGHTDGRTGGHIDGERVTVQAGEDWDTFVERCVRDGLSGVECLSGIPGLVGSTPIQNVGAYGQEVSQTISSVRVYDREDHEVRDVPAAACGFAYRHSAFKDDLERNVVLSVTYDLIRSPQSSPVAYAELAKTLGVEIGERVPLKAAREAVLRLRRGKGMVLDAKDPDTISAGSFFTNPILTEDEAAALARIAPGHPRWDLPGGKVKVPAAWLIEHAGFPKGHERGPVRISTKHTLALTNPTGKARAADLLALAREVRDGVREKFGVTLVNEPVLVGLSL